MFATFRKHQKWIWIGAMIVVIPSFVVFFTPGSGQGGGGMGEVNLGTVNGRPVGRDEFLTARKEVALRYRLRFGQWPDNASMARFNLNLDQEAMTHIALLQKLEADGIKVGDEAVAEQIRTYFKNPETGAYEPAALDRFIKNLASEAGYSEEDFFNFIRHQVGIQHLAGVNALSGELVAPRAAEDEYRRENEQLLTSGIFFNASNYVSKVKVNTNDLAQYYTNQLGRYRIPVRVAVHYVAFEAINYLAEAGKQMAQDTNLTVRIEKQYLDLGTNSFTDKDGKVLPPDAAKEQLKDELRKAIATTVARREAATFSRVLEDMDKHGMAEFKKQAEAGKLTIKTTAPFTIADGPKEFEVGPDFARSAFALTTEEPVALKPIVGKDAVYVIALKERLSEVTQPLAEVKEKVTADYREQESRNLMRKAVDAAYSALTNGMAGGKSFEDAAKTAKLSPVTFPAIARKDRSSEAINKHVSFFTFQNNAWETAPGKVGGPFFNGDTAFLIHVSQRKPAPAEGMSAELPKLLEGLRDNFRGMAENEWVQKQAQVIQMPVNESKK